MVALFLKGNWIITFDVCELIKKKKLTNFRNKPVHESAPTLRTYYTMINQFFHFYFTLQIKSSSHVMRVDRLISVRIVNLEPLCLIKWIHTIGKLLKNVCQVAAMNVIYQVHSIDSARWKCRVQYELYGLICFHCQGAITFWNWEN